MCQFCAEHGRGNRWYLNPDNFSEELLKDRHRQKVIEEISGWGIDYYIDFTSRITRLINWPVIGKVVKAAVNRMASNEHGGQVVSLEDSLRLLEYAKDFVLIPCACRRLVGNRLEMACLNFGPVKEQMRRYVPGEPMEELTLEEASEVVKQYDEKGHFHQVLYAKAPFPICICNCDERYCTSLKQRFANRVDVAIYKGHEVCRVDREKCVDCDEPFCLERCSFEALSYDREKGQARVNLFRCFGCGLCRGACPRGALALVERESIPALVGVW
jgi:heterodisulfide reductase subunit A-like polyferredoxin